MCNEGPWIQFQYWLGNWWGQESEEVGKNICSKEVCKVQNENQSFVSLSAGDQFSLENENIFIWKLFLNLLKKMKKFYFPLCKTKQFECTYIIQTHKY